MLNLDEQSFKDITHNKAKFDGVMSYYGKDCRRYSYGDFYFLFNQRGEFYKVVEKMTNRDGSDLTNQLSFQNRPVSPHTKFLKNTNLLGLSFLPLQMEAM